MDLTSHGKKRGSQGGGGDQSEKDDGGNKKRLVTSEVIESLDIVSTTTNVNSITPFLFQNAPFQTSSIFPRPYDLSMNINRVRRSESLPQHADTHPLYSSQWLPQLQQRCASPIFPVPHAKAANLSESTYSSQAGSLFSYSSLHETQLASPSTTTAPRRLTSSATPTSSTAQVSLSSAFDQP